MEITFGKIKFSELEHLPEPEREVLMRAVLESDELQAFRRRSQRIIDIVFYSTAAIYVAIALISDLPVWMIGPTFVFGILLTFAATLPIRILLEIRMVRRMLNKKLNSSHLGSV